MAHEPPFLDDFLLTLCVVSSAMSPTVSMTFGILSISAVYGLCACNLTLVVDCIKSIVVMPPNLLLNKKPCGGSVLPCSVCSLDVDIKECGFHFVPSCASVNATGVTFNCNKAPNRGCWSAS